jgi:hypothetical protein
MTERKGGTQNRASDPSDGREIPRGTDEGADEHADEETSTPAPDGMSDRTATGHEQVARADHVPSGKEPNDQRQPDGADSAESR